MFGLIVRVNSAASFSMRRGWFLGGRARFAGGVRGGMEFSISICGRYTSLIFVEVSDRMGVML